MNKKDKSNSYYLREVSALRRKEKLGFGSQESRNLEFEVSRIKYGEDQSQRALSRQPSWVMSQNPGSISARLQIQQESLGRIIFSCLRQEDREKWIKLLNDCID